MSADSAVTPSVPESRHPAIGDCLLSRALDRHTAWGPTSPDELARWLKHAALFYRCVVVPDSDLNHNPVFASALRDHTFRGAVERGFVRRAARVTDDGPMSQARLHEHFLVAAPWAVNEVRPEHVRELDALFDRAERTYVPLHWRLEDASTVFGERVLVVLKHAQASGMLSDPAQGALADRIMAYTDDALTNGPPLTARRIDAEIFGQRGGESTALHRPVWDLVVDAYNGNLRYLFAGICASDPLFEPRGGSPHFYEQPRVMELEQAREAPWHEALRGERGFPVPGSDEAIEWQVDRSELDRLQLDTVLELREASEPDELFSLRHRALANGFRTAGEGLGGLDAATRDYLTRMTNVHRGLVVGQRKLGVEAAWKAELVAMYDAYRRQSTGRRLGAALGSGVVLALALAGSVDDFVPGLIQLTTLRNVTTAVLIVPQLYQFARQLTRVRASSEVLLDDELRSGAMALRAVSHDHAAETLMVADRALLRRAADNVRVGDE